MGPHALGPPLPLLLLVCLFRAASCSGPHCTCTCTSPGVAEGIGRRERKAARTRAVDGKGRAGPAAGRGALAGIGHGRQSDQNHCAERVFHPHEVTAYPLVQKRARNTINNAKKVTPSIRAAATIIEERISEAASG